MPRSSPSLGRTAAARIVVAAPGPLDAVGAATKLVEALGLAFALRLGQLVGDRRSPLMQEVSR